MIFIISATAFLASILTFFSGFGLGTILTPVFVIFFPIEQAIAMTAIVHFSNNIFKFILIGKHFDNTVLVKFGFIAMIYAVVGAQVLNLISNISPISVYNLGDSVHQITIVKLLIGSIILFFTIFETLPYFSKLQFDTKYLCIGGALSGFFGGLSGNQGALRTAFLSKLNLSKESFIATGVVIACMVDISRLFIYSQKIFTPELFVNSTTVTIATLSAILGAIVGNKILRKVTMDSIQKVVALCLILLSLTMMTGLI